MSIAETEGRTQRALEWLRLNPSIVAIIQLFGWTSWQSAFRWIERQLKYGQISAVGKVEGKNVYGGKCKTDNLPHEVGISAVLVHFALEGWEWLRGEDVDPRFRADADVKEYGHVFRLELDRDTERRKALERRLKVYEGTADFVLFVAPHERRLNQAKEIGSFLGDQLLLTTFAKAAKDPFAKDVWQDVYGNKCSL